MKSGLYTVEVLAHLASSNTADRTNLPEPDDSAMIISNKGTTFVKLHRAKITTQHRDGCYFCNVKLANIVLPISPFDLHNLPAQKARYCFYCGKRLKTEEVAK